MLDEAQRTLAGSACQQLMMRYAASIDLGDLDRLLSIFTADAVWHRPGMNPMRGHAEIRSFFEYFWKARSAGRPHYLDVHMLTTCSIEVESADRATGATWCVMYSAPDHTGVGPAPMTDKPELVVLYRDVFARGAQGWQIAEHRAEHLFKSAAYTLPPVPPSMQAAAHE